MVGCLVHDNHRLGRFEGIAVQALDKVDIIGGDLILGWPNLAPLFRHYFDDLEPHPPLLVRDGPKEVTAIAPARGQVEVEGVVLGHPEPCVLGPGVEGGYKRKRESM